jgi:hypothetical protein
MLVERNQPCVLRNFIRQITYSKQSRVVKRSHIHSPASTQRQQQAKEITYSQPSKHTKATTGKRDHRCGSVAATEAAVMIGTENR